MSGGCNGTFLRLEVDAMSTRLWQNIPITKQLVQDALGFIVDREKMMPYLNVNFVHLMNKAKIDFALSAQYVAFADICKTVFEKALTSEDASTQIAICIFFEEVSNAYAPYYSRKHMPQLKEESNIQFDVEAYMAEFRARRQRQSTSSKIDLNKKTKEADATPP
jgi:hypothetical protein